MDADHARAVIEEPASRRNGSAAAARGYFAVRPHAAWLRLDPIAPDARLRWPLRSRPENHRVRITDHLTFVIEPTTRERGDGRTASAFGYFVAERDGRWLRLDPIGHGALFGGPLTASRPGVAVPITARLRFVIQRPTPEHGGAQLGSAAGYFVIERPGRSLRLNPIGNGGLFRQAH